MKFPMNSSNIKECNTFVFSIMTRIKLIWDFRSPDAKPIAEHHVKHIKEYIIQKNVDCDITGVEDLSDMYSIAYMVVKEEDMRPIRDVLKPHRGKYYED